MCITDDPVINEFRDMIIGFNYYVDYGCFPKSSLENDFEDDSLYGGMIVEGNRYLGLRDNQIPLLQDFIKARKEERKEELKKKRREEKKELKEQVKKTRREEKKELKEQLKKTRREEKQLRKIRREEKRLRKIRREEKRLKKAKMADITKVDGDGVALKRCKLNEVEDGLTNVDEMELVVDQQREVVLPNEQVRNLMEGGLKPCAMEAEKKNVPHSRND